jgi:hypothetical protein
MKPRPRPKPDSEPRKQDEIVHLDDLIPRKDIIGGAKKLRFGEPADRDSLRKPAR